MRFQHHVYDKWWLISGDPSVVYELNSTRGEVYEEVFAACDHRFTAEKKLERFKIASVQYVFIIMRMIVGE